MHLWKKFSMTDVIERSITLRMPLGSGGIPHRKIFAISFARWCHKKEDEKKFTL